MFQILADGYVHSLQHFGNADDVLPQVPMNEGVGKGSLSFIEPT